MRMGSSSRRKLWGKLGDFRRRLILAINEETVSKDVDLRMQSKKIALTNRQTADPLNPRNNKSN